ncbi:MAG: hypothetical protein HGA19_22895 [Oscillochloris sp.]|nr:hypothetical protein [Oscillochloris sp.]
MANAEASLEKARTNGTTAADIADAEAQLRSAQATLDDLKAHARGSRCSSVQLRSSHRR